MVFGAGVSKFGVRKASYRDLIWEAGKACFDSVPGLTPKDVEGLVVGSVMPERTAFQSHISSLAAEALGIKPSVLSARTEHMCASGTVGIRYAYAFIAAGLADRCEVQLAYAIGVSEPVSVHVDSEGTGKIGDERLCELAREFFPLTPRGIIDYLDLRRPIYAKTAAYGHFGREDGDFTWERTDKVDVLRQAAGLAPNLAAVPGCR